MKPGSRRPGITEDGGILTVAVRARAVDGAANAAVLAAIAAWLGIATGRITLEHGAGSRLKRLNVDGLAEDRYAAALRELKVDG